MSNFKLSCPREELPFDKFLRLGPEALSDAELLAIMLRTGTREKSPVDLGREVLKLAGDSRGLLGLYHFNINELKSIEGIGEVKAVQLLCIAEIAKRTACMQSSDKLSFCKPDTVASYYMEKMRHRESEQLILILLDNKNNLISDSVISVGTINSTLISVREVFVHALRANATGIILIHNHPSGDPSPSRQDQLITNKIKEVSSLVEIPLLDHIIIGDNQYTSFKQKGLL